MRDAYEPRPRPGFSRGAFTYLSSPFDAARSSFAALTAPGAGCWVQLSLSAPADWAVVSTAEWGAILSVPAVGLAAVSGTPLWPGAAYAPAATWIVGQVLGLGIGMPVASSARGLDEWIWVAPGNTIWVAPSAAATGPSIASALRCGAVHLEGLNADEFEVRATRDL